MFGGDPDFFVYRRHFHCSQTMWRQETANADRLEREYLSKGMDIEVTVSGERNTTIKLKYVLMSRPLVYKLTNETEYLQNMKKLGFKKVILTDGYYHTWTFDLTKFP